MGVRVNGDLPGAATLELVTSGVTPFVLSRLSQRSDPRTVRVSAFKRPGGSRRLVAESLDALRRAGAVEFEGAAKQVQEVTLTLHGVRLVDVYRSMLSWAASITLDVDPAGSFLSWRLMANFASAWSWGVLTVLAGRPATVDSIADAVGRKREEIETLLADLAALGLLTKTAPGNATWVILKDMKRASAPLATAVSVERTFRSDAASILPAHVELVSRFCIESINVGHFRPSLNGSYAAVCRLPNGLLAGSVAQFSHGEFYSIHAYRDGEQLDGGFWGDVDACLSLLSEGRVDGLRSFGLDKRGGERLASAIAVGLGHTRRSFVGPQS